MKKDLTLEGVKYNAKAGNVMDVIRKMVDIANEQNVFVYEDINGTPLMIDPGMSAEEGLQLLRDIRTGRVNIKFYEAIRSVSDVVNNMEKLAKDNDFVISNINGTIFRVAKNMSADEILNTLAVVRKAEKAKYEKATQQLNKGPNETCVPNIVRQNDDR